jgi:hypothetical protein
MAPDLNSLPPSRSTSSSPLQPRTTYSTAPPMDPYLNRRETPSPRSSSVSLAAAATMNAADINRRNSAAGNNRGSPRTGRASSRRTSAVAMNLNLNDPSLPSPGELSSSDHRSSLGNFYTAASPSGIGGHSSIATGDPHHHARTPSLGEIHQELEQEQEAQVNRLLQMIRTQQLQLEQMQRHQQEHNSRQASQSTSATVGVSSSNNTTNNSIAVIDDLTPTSERSFSFQTTTPFPPLPTQPRPLRRSSRGPPSAGASPALRPLPLPGRESSHTSSGDWGPPSPIDIARRNSTRDESAFYQAETANLTRENQMLRLRIRELERQLGDMNPNNQANTPPIPSNLATSPPVVDNSSLASRPVAASESDKD